MSKRIGPLMIDIEGQSLSAQDIALLSSPYVGGLILFTRNFESIDQLSALVSSIRSVNPGCIIAVDHEGGRVQRFKEGFTHIPPMAMLGDLHDISPDLADDLAFDLGSLLANELLALDIDISFAPVLDRDHGVSDVIGDRAFSSDLPALIHLSGRFMAGMQAVGMATTGKHFPGHGAIKADSHIAIPVDQRPFEQIEQEDMAAFAAFSGGEMDAVMPAHVIYDAVDPSPAGFSTYWLQNTLRKSLSFKGVVLSDDLSMEGASVAGSYAERCDAALNAGCDMVLVCNNRSAALEVLAHLETNQFCGPFGDSERLSRMLKANRRGSRVLDLPAQDRVRALVNAYWEGGLDSLCKALKV